LINIPSIRHKTIKVQKRQRQQTSPDMLFTQ